MLKKFLYIVSFCVLFVVTGANANDLSLHYTKETESLVRKMKVYKTPAWVCKITTKDLKDFYFVGPKSMFEFYFNPKKFKKAKLENNSGIKEIIVTDYFTLKPIRGEQAYYVYGANEISLAGDDLPAFRSYSDAKKFAKKHNGKRIFKFFEVKKALIELLNNDV